MIIFVFGSNLAGRHGAGAAKFAVQHYGAEYGVGEGLTGSAYALPTKDRNIQTRPWPDICRSIERFTKFATENPDLKFLLTPVGCGLAGINARQMWSTFGTYGLSENVFLSSRWMMDHQIS